MNLRKGSKLFETGLRIAFDIDIIGDSAIVYDIARERIIKEGANLVRLELRKAVITGLKELGIFEQLTPEAQLSLTSRPTPVTRFTRGGVTDETLLEEVAALIPEEKWPWGLHKQVAKKLHISSTLASRAITTLLNAGRVKYPQPSTSNEA